VADQRTYNARVTTEALEKKFRDTFPSQAGAELVDDLYASGVIVPTVDFTAAAQGSELRSDLQTAWDTATLSFVAQNNTKNITSTPGFYTVSVTVGYTAGTASPFAKLLLTDGATNYNIWRFDIVNPGTGIDTTATSWDGVVWVNTGFTLKAQTNQTNTVMTIHARQIATSTGDLINPLGFTFS
jgi:hypothetical protein